MSGIGADVGTYNLVCCFRDEQGNFVRHREVNAFLELPLEDRFMFNVMRDTRTPEMPNGVPLIEREKVAYVCGEAAVSMAYTMTQLELKRPMVAGCVNPKEKDAFQILSIMIHSLLGEIKRDEVLYYSVPANAINQETDADYHNKILEAIFKAYKSEQGFKVDPHPINEGLALIYAELSNKAFSGLGISFGAGLVNICYAMFGNPVFKFSLANSGDWIDKMAAKATGESPTFINREKPKIDLGRAPTSLIERAIQTQYHIMIEHTVTGIKNGLIGVKKNFHADAPVNIVIAGGTSSPPGFTEMFKEVISQANLALPIGEIIKPAEPLYSVCKGCCLAAEAATK